VTLDANRSIVLINKADLPARTNGALAGLRVSAATGAGLDELRATMLARTGALDLARMARERSVLNARLARLLEDARAQLDELGPDAPGFGTAGAGSRKGEEALHLYEEATGRRYHDGLLDVIFSRFCIGK
jgi:tRNA modification GTPase